MAEVKPFQFNIDKYEETKNVYIGILDNLGVKNPEKFLQDKVAEIPEDKRNGLMFNSIVASLFKDSDERKKAAAKALEGAKQTKGISPYIVAYLAEMSDQYIPFDTVLTAGKMVGDGKSLQMGCGEGKTGVLSMAAYAKLQEEDKQVFLTSSTPLLAAEALDKLVFYDNVGMADKVTLITPDGIVKGKIDEKTGRLMIDDQTGKPIKEKIDFEGKSEDEIKALLAKAYKSPLVSSDNTTLMQHAMKGYLPKPAPGIDRELLADKADFVLLDSYRPLQQTEELTKAEQAKAFEQRRIAHDILRGVIDSEELYVIDDANQYVDFTNTGREKIVNAINERFSSDESIDKNQLYDYVYDALVVETVYKENRDYQILNDGRKIVSEDRASGVSIDLPEGIKQALEIKLQSEGKYIGEISEEKRVIDTLNVQSFFNEFFNGTTHFVSGTLGIDSNEIVGELRDNFNIDVWHGDVYEIPPQKGRRREDQGKTIFSSETDKRKAIIENAIKEIENGRPVLIGTVSEEEINALREELESRELGDKAPRVLEYTAASEEKFKADKEKLTSEEFHSKYGVSKEEYKEYADLIKIESGKSNVLTLGTSIIGRGTTIKTSKEVNGNGGIHVILDGLHETSSRNQEQYKARTARGENKGSTKEFFSIEDIPEEYRDAYAEECKDGIVEKDRAEEIYKEVYGKIDARTSNIRHYVVDFVNVTREQLAQVDILELSSQDKDELKSLITARAFSIKNRACGVSDKFKDRIDEYKREIEAYTEMYVDKYIVKEPNFNERQWLEENGYEDIAKTYIPFSKEREEKIFTLAGIKNQAQQARQEKVKKATNETRESILGEQTRQIEVKKEKDGGERDD